jgi:hypothetical protein
MTHTEHSRRPLLLCVITVLITVASGALDSEGSISVDSAGNLVLRSPADGDVVINGTRLSHLLATIQAQSANITRLSSIRDSLREVVSTNEVALGLHSSILSAHTSILAYRQSTTDYYLEFLEALSNLQASGQVTTTATTTTTTTTATTASISPNPVTDTP